MLQACARCWRTGSSTSPSPRITTLSARESWRRSTTEFSERGMPVLHQSALKCITHCVKYRLVLVVARIDGRAADCSCSTITGERSWCWCMAGCGSLLRLWEETQTLPASALQGVTQAMMSTPCWLSSTNLRGTNDRHCFSWSMNTFWTACTCFQW